MTATPKKKKDQLALAQDGDKLFLRTGPIPTTPGGWGLRNPGLKGPGQRSDSLVAIQKGGRWAEIGPYYDFPNDLVTLHFLPGRGHGQSVTCEFGRAAATALLQPSAVGAIIPARHDPERWTFGFPKKGIRPEITKGGAP
jgi:hypothetical protein